MGYCKHCGMNSSIEDKCQWCGRQLASSAPQPVGQPQPIEDNSPQSRLALYEEEQAMARKSFYYACSILLVLASALMFWKPPLYPCVTLCVLFLTGHLLRRLNIIEPFEDDWLAVGLMFLATMFVPAFVVFFSYLAYGLVNRNLNVSLAWLFGAYMAMVTMMELVSVLSWGHTGPADIFFILQGVEKLGYIAAVVGWMSGGTSDRISLSWLKYTNSRYVGPWRR